MTASRPSKRDASRVKHKVIWLTVGLITRMSIYVAEKKIIREEILQIIQLSISVL
jgi:hypothetical protein